MPRYGRIDCHCVKACAVEVVGVTFGCRFEGSGAAGTLDTMRTDVVLLNLLVWMVGMSGQQRLKGQILQSYRHVRSVRYSRNDL